MNLFVDSNIFLDFYHFSNDDLDELKKLVDVINKGEITLVLTKQVINEVRRNRDNKIADAYKKFKDSKIDLNLPQICKGYPEYTVIKRSLSLLKSSVSDLDTKLVKDIQERTLKADSIIKQLFDISVVIDSDKYIEQAKTRYDLGNPPGKDDSYGDALNWISLISDIEKGSDLFLISDDKDYKCALNENLLNSYLLEEWKEVKKSEVYFYTKLSDFFNEHQTDIQLKVEEDKNKLITELSQSPNFAYTHSVISKLRKYVSFTNEQIRELADIGINNSQVYQILSDEDLSSFYEKLFENNEEIIEDDIYNKIMTQIHEEEINQEENAETVPF